jgi:prevent-host-death family protein
MSMTNRPLKLGLEQARAQLPALVSQAEKGGRCVITRHGRPCAAIVPVTDLARPNGGGALLALRGTGAGIWRGDAGAAVRALRDEWA